MAKKKQKKNTIVVYLEILILERRLPLQMRGGEKPAQLRPGFDSVTRSAAVDRSGPRCCGGTTPLASSGHADEDLAAAQPHCPSGEQSPVLQRRFASIFTCVISAHVCQILLPACHMLYRLPQLKLS